MKDGVITSEDVDNMIKDIKSGKTEKKAVTYSKKTRDKIKFLLIFCSYQLKVSSMIRQRLVQRHIKVTNVAGLLQYTGLLK